MEPHSAMQFFASQRISTVLRLTGFKDAAVQQRGQCGRSARKPEKL